MKIALLFRGPIRPNPNKVKELTLESMEDVRSSGHEVHTYLATWMTHEEHHASDLVNNKIYDNIIVQLPTTEEFMRKYVKRETYGVYPVSNIFRMYYQSLTAIKVITGAADYDYIIHSRTDMNMLFGDKLEQWFDKEHYVSPHNNPPWICDWIGVATPENMLKSWDYGTLENLGKLIDETNVPEHIVTNIIDTAGVKRRIGHAHKCYIEPHQLYQ